MKMPWSGCSMKFSCTLSIINVRSKSRPNLACLLLNWLNRSRLQASTKERDEISDSKFNPIKSQQKYEPLWPKLCHRNRKALEIVCAKHAGRKKDIPELSSLNICIQKTIASRPIISIKLGVNRFTMVPLHTFGTLQNHIND